MMKQTSATEEHTFTHEDISRRARELWQARGQPSGQDDEIWFEAERSLAEESRQRAASAAKPSSNSELMKRAEPRGAATEPVAPRRETVTPTETGGMAAPKVPPARKRAGKAGR